MDLKAVRERIEANDSDGLLRLIDGACASRDWDDLVTLREWCYEAVERGKQLWGVAHHVEYRLALEAPGEYAAVVIEADPSGFALGPLTEVAASSHEWSELRDDLSPGPAGVLVAHERVLRGEDLTSEQIVDDVLELPMVLAGWEPKYELATYHSDHADFPKPSFPLLEPAAFRSVSSTVDDDDLVDAWLALVTPWLDQSNGRARVSVVKGSAFDAIGTLGVAEGRLVTLLPAEAMAAMAWAAASGGAHGKRRGTAAGRFAAWWTATVTTGLGQEWPPSADDLGQAVDDVRWFAWAPVEELTGWDLHLAAESPGRGVSVAMAATDKE